MPPVTAIAREVDVADIVALRGRVAESLTREFGRGHWSSCPTERSVLRDVAASRVLVLRDKDLVLGTVRLSTKKPWAIDVSYFTPVGPVLYLHDLAVEPTSQRQGVGRELVEAAAKLAKGWPAHGLRLDAYDAAAGAAPFYVKCGFKEVGHVTYRGVPLVYLERLL